MSRSLGVFGAYAASVGLIMFGLVKGLGVETASAAVTTSAIATALAVLMAYHSMREGHEWNRRHETVRLMVEWDQRARIHLDALEQRYPQIFDFPAITDEKWNDPNYYDDDWCIPEADVEKLKSAGSSADADVDWSALRSHLISLLNFFESLAIACEQSTVKPDVVRDSLGPLVIVVVRFAKPFMKELGERQKRDPWPPLSRIVRRWQHEKLLEQIAGLRPEVGEPPTGT